MSLFGSYEKRSEILDQFNRFLEGSWMFADAFGFEIQVKRP
jgi:hypothetical protein